MPPTILLIPGLWEGPTVYTSVSNTLHSHGYPTTIAALPSTGTTSPGNPSMSSDISSIRLVARQLIEEEQKEVILVCHSAGAFLGSEAIEGLDAKGRAERGLKGGVRKIVFLAGGIAPEGYEHVDLPFFDLSKGGGEMHCVNPEQVLFNDLDEGSRAKWMKALSPQPAQGWNGTTRYCGWKDVESVYLVCEKDQVLPVEIQLQAAGLAGSEVVRCSSGHCVMISMPEKVVEVIVSAAEGI